jgi:hypothetical protein
MEQMIVPFLAEADFSQVIFILIFLLVAFFQWLGGVIKKRRGGGEELEQDELARFFEELDEKTAPSDGLPSRPPARPRQPAVRPAASRELSPPPPLPGRSRVRDDSEDREHGDFVVRRGEKSRRALEGDEPVDPLARFRRGREAPLLTAQEEAALKRIEKDPRGAGIERSAYDLKEASYGRGGMGANHGGTSIFMDLIRSPKAARDAIILKEIFDRPLALRDRTEILELS